MTPQQFRRELEARGLNGERAAEALRVTPSAVSRWLSGERPIPGMVMVALESIPAADRQQTGKTISRRNGASRKVS